MSILSILTQGNIVLETNLLLRPLVRDAWTNMHVSLKLLQGNVK